MCVCLRPLAQTRLNRSIACPSWVSVPPKFMDARVNLILNANVLGGVAWVLVRS